MTQHVELDYSDPVHEGFFDAIQELLGAAVPSLNITVQDATTLALAANTGNEQQSAAIEGRYRWRTGNTTAVLPSGGGTLSDGVHDVFITASDNDFTGALGDIDSPTNYSFGLEIKQASTTPSTELSRKVGEILVINSGAAIGAFWSTVGPRLRGGQGGFFAAEHSSQNAVIARAATSQAKDILRVEDSSKAALVSVDKDGKIRFGESGSSLADSAGVVTLTGKLKVSGNFAANGKTPAAPPSRTISNAAYDSSIDISNFTLNELAKFVAQMSKDLVDCGIFANP